MLTKAEKTYPGQCVHAWVKSKDGGQICERNCGSTCRRDEHGKIESYSAGSQLLKTPPVRRRVSKGGAQ